MIGGKWIPAKSGKTFETINLAYEEVLALLTESDKENVDDVAGGAKLTRGRRLKTAQPDVR